MFRLHQLTRSFCLFALLTVVLPMSAFADAKFPLNAKRILFLGDSITHAGGYVSWIETQLRLRGVDPMPEMINVGLSSETVSGLSEPDHPFPRPDVHERVDRALKKIKPDVVVACYGMNDGIYYPFGQERFQGYQDGVIRLIKKVHDAQAKLILVTPPPFDPVPLRGKGKLKPAGEERYAYFAMYEDYNDVMKRYGQWILKQKDRVEMVIDVHMPTMDYLAEKRKQNPEFTLARDGIHPNAEGHRIIGEAILKAWGISSTEPPAELLKLVSEKTRLLHDAWLSDVGHKRPGVKKGLPLAEAQTKVQALDAKIEALVKKSQSSDAPKNRSPK
ncbi:MAG: SGNH/GDSL hydrolase family protein [Planctomycetaceae bacterium]|nr:SGNH/GDSL hydrolase family protein [Planctomycetaceae bacterium]